MDKEFIQSLIDSGIAKPPEDTTTSKDPSVWNYGEVGGQTPVFNPTTGRWELPMSGGEYYQDSDPGESYQYKNQTPPVFDQATGKYVQYDPFSKSLVGFGEVGGGKASDIMAKVTREEWADYMKRFFPLEEELIASYKNPEKLEQRVGISKDLSNAAFDTAQQTSEREAKRYGIELKDDPTYQRKLSMEKTAGEIDAGNETRRHMKTIDQKIMTGGLGGRELI